MQRMQDKNRSTGSGSVHAKLKTNPDIITEQFNYLLDLKTAKFRFYYKADKEIYLPSFKGATFRGVLGTVLKEVAEKAGHSAVYEYIFDTPNDGRLRDVSGDKAPRPYILEAPITFKRKYYPGELFSMDLILVGKAIEYIPYLVYIFDEAGHSSGIGKWRSSGFGNYQLLKVTCFNNESEIVYYKDEKILVENVFSPCSLDKNINIPQENSLLIINFITPAHIVYDSAEIEKTKNHPFTFPAMIQSLLWRIYLLYGFHQSQDVPEYQKIPVRELEIVNKNLTWEKFEHFSNRQYTGVPIVGFRGSVVLQGDWQQYLPLLKLGEIIHVGRETTFGLGKYIVNFN